MSKNKKIYPPNLSDMNAKIRNKIAAGEKLRREALKKENTTDAKEELHFMVLMPKLNMTHKVQPMKFGEL